MNIYTYEHASLYASPGHGHARLRNRGSILPGINSNLIFLGVIRQDSIVTQSLTR